MFELLRNRFEYNDETYHNDEIPSIMEIMFWPDFCKLSRDDYLFIKEQLVAMYLVGELGDLKDD